MSIGDAPLTTLARRELLHAILDRRLSSGDRLVVTKLASALNMSRTPVREALKRLAVTRVVETNGASGFRVGALSQRDQRDIVDLLLLLEPRAATDATAAPDAARSELATRLTALDAVGEGHDFHVELGRAAENPYVGEAIDALNERLAIARPSIASPCTSGGDHEAIVQAGRDGRSEDARAACVDHLHTIRDRIYEVSP